MKRLFFALMAVTTLFSATAQEKKMKKEELFEVRSMRTFENRNTNIQLGKTSVHIYDFGDIKVHNFETRDFFNTQMYLVQKGENGVLLEFTTEKDNNKEIIDYIAGLNLKHIDAMVSYHPIGQDFYKDDRVKFDHIYTNQLAVDYMAKSGVQYLKALKMVAGEQMDATQTEHTDLLKDGPITLQGIDFEITSTDVGFDVAIPAINAIHIHMLGSHNHTLVFNRQFLDYAISYYKGLQKKGYTTYLSSHNAPETPGDLTNKILYLENMKRILNASKTRDEFVKTMLDTYPGFGWEQYILRGGDMIFAAQTKAQPKKTEVAMNKGTMEVYDYGQVKMHVYGTHDMMHDYVIIIEKNKRAAIIESPAFFDNFDELAEYLAKNNIQTEGIFPSYHPFGASFIDHKALKGTKVYMNKRELDYWDHEFGAVMKQGIPKKFGDKVDTAFYAPDVLLQDGEIEVAGTQFIISTTFDGFNVEVPEIGAAYVHILGHDVHSEILGPKHLDNMIKQLIELTAKGYTTFLSSHYQPETAEDAKTKLAYLKGMKRIVAQSKNAQDFMTKMKQAYPSYQEGYLPMTARVFFAQKK